MAVAQSNIRRSTYNSYTVSGLETSILDSSQISSLEDRYLLGEQLGLGQFGVIRVCYDRYSDESFACKSLSKERLITSGDVCSIKLEIEIMSRLSGHPNVVNLKAVYEDENFVHLVMELCAGGELFHRLEKDGHFPESKARVLFRHLMEVVTYCHDNGIVHRDLKPENILMATTSSSSPIKLADFGLATYIKAGQSLYGTVGSPFYIAPEVLAGGYNQAADVWSAGVILYILLSGMPPFWGKTKSKIFDAVRATDLRFPSEYWDHVSVSAKDLIARMLCRDPARRLTAAQVLGHCWITQHEGDLQSCGPKDASNRSCATMEACSFSAPLDRDFSFSSASPASTSGHDLPSPIFSCRSSFSSFLVGITPCTQEGGFSFHSSEESDNLKFSSPITAMPSFRFFSPVAATDSSNANPIPRESSFGNIFKPVGALVRGEVKTTDNNVKGTEVRRATTPYRTTCIQGKRNRTIGLGECEQLDLMVTESIIRWASCQLPCTASLTSSLVC